MRPPWLPAVLAVQMAMVLPACDEILPPRSDPETVLQMTIGISSEMIDIEEGIATRGGNIVLFARNIYDEVLSDEALIRAVATIRLGEFPDSSRTLVLGPADISPSRLLVGRTLTLPVNDTITLMQPWDQRTDGGKPFWELGLAFTRRVTDKGEVYYESDPVHLTVLVTLQLFKKVQMRRLPPAEHVVTYRLWRTPTPG